MKPRKFAYLSGCLALVTLVTFVLILILIFNPVSNSLSLVLGQDLEPIKMHLAGKPEEASQIADFTVRAPTPRLSWA